MVDTHGIIGCNGTIYKGPFRFSFISRNTLFENAVLFPELEYIMLELYEINSRVYFFNHILNKYRAGN
jgi:hypothetical protein